ncbi:unnamed protein product [Didymodactylos carnosus]|uniref:Uncharacterized protein n=1 Tax=Didymodactylos carnosus TaxID=1234261 RepID=A0A814SS74_9BILA|nr:unnamed protein product [Didymodactylos carnosus]CAF1151129.1 unnamed protein product [Didymodactylos carnosus]CAF3855282.1 unnamed protein product [Didymodactylos carnosus]CAF3914662.1 unnamed protein product [Didymodactylos carnosus]
MGVNLIPIEYDKRDMISGDGHHLSDQISLFHRRAKTHAWHIKVVSTLTLVKKVNNNSPYDIVINAHNPIRRSNHNCNLRARLGKAAQSHANWMAQTHTMSHTENVPGRADVGDRARQAGYHFKAVGENIACTSGQKQLRCYSDEYVDEQSRTSAEYSQRQLQSDWSSGCSRL